MVKIKLPSTFQDITIKQVMNHGNKELSDLHLLRIYGNLTKEEAERLPMVLVLQRFRLTLSVRLDRVTVAVS